MAYTTQSKIETRLGQSLPSCITTADLNVYLDEVKAYIDAYTDTTFETTASSSRIYSVYPNNPVVPIDNVLGDIVVEYLTDRTESGDTWTAYETTSYRLLPENSERKSMIDFTVISPFYIQARQASIRVTGVFAYSLTVPLDIQMVATEMVIDLLRDRDDVDLPVRSERLGDVSYTYEAQTFSQRREKHNVILNRYRQIEDLRI